MNIYWICSFTQVFDTLCNHSISAPTWNQEPNSTSWVVAASIWGQGPVLFKGILVRDEANQRQSQVLYGISQPMTCDLAFYGMRVNGDFKPDVW